MPTDRKLNLVLEGGGVKGIGFIGAIEEFERHGYSWACLGATSAGAVVATLLAVGYKGKELKTILDQPEMNFIHMMDDAYVRQAFFKIIEPLRTKKHYKLVFRLGSISKLWKRLSINHGLFNGDYILETVRNLIKAKIPQDGPYTFADLEKDSNLNAPKLSLMVTDISNRRLLVLPRDLHLLNKTPDQMEIALAMRMSMSFPFFFTPIKLTVDENELWFMDGGVLSNFPYWYIEGLSTSDRKPKFPTVGLLLDEEPSGPIKDVKSLGMALLSTMIAPLDQAFSVFEPRVIKIDVNGVSTLNFGLSDKLRNDLYASGERAANNFLSGFDYSAAVQKPLMASWYDSTTNGNANMNDL